MKNQGSTSPTVEEMLDQWAQQASTCSVTPAQRKFIGDMREARAAGVALGWMRQIIGWEWRHLDPVGYIDDERIGELARWRRERPLALEVNDHQITVRRHAICATGTGIAGYFDVLLPNGQQVIAVGRWDDARHPEREVDVDAPDWCFEGVWIDGDLQEQLEEEEAGIFLVLRGDDDGVLIEDIALVIYRETQTPAPIAEKP